MRLTPEQIESVAPDAKALQAARKVSKPSVWSGLGRDARAMWGECKGSAVYQTRVALGDLASKCSCPSRKFPCKHALGLMMLGVDGGVPEGAAPEWVDEWLGRREASEKAKATRKEASAPSPAAREKRTQKRDENIAAGLDQLGAWLDDIVRQGVLALEVESETFWEQQARRLTDAQAPGLAERVRRVGQRVGVGRGWEHDVLDGLGELSLLVQSYRRIDALPEALRHDLRLLFGVSLTKDEVAAHGDVTEDDWTVLGQQDFDEGRVSTRVSWLLGRSSKRFACIRDHSVGNQGFRESPTLGSRLRAKLAFWPSAHPLRAFVLERIDGDAMSGELDVGATETVAELLDRTAAALGRVPWLDVVPSVLRSVTPVRHDKKLVLRDEAGHALPLSDTSHRQLWAVSGGRAVHAAGVWDGRAFRAFGLFADRFYPLRRGRA